MSDHAANTSLLAARAALTRVLAGVRVEITDDIIEYREFIEVLNDAVASGGPHDANVAFLSMRHLMGKLADLDDEETLYPEIYDPLVIDEAQLMTLHSYEDTDFGQSEALLHLYIDRLRFVLGMGWFVWNGLRWEIDDRNAVWQFAIVAARIRLRAANHVLEKAEGKEAIDAAMARVRNASARRSVPSVKKALEAAASHPGAITEPGDLDAHSLRLGVRNGVIDLRAAELIPPSPHYMISKRANITFFKDAPCPRWLRFLDEVFLGDRDMIEYIQRCVGYSLTGEMTEQCFFILHGHGANGKSVFTEVLRALLGEYGAAVDFGMFLANESTAVRNDLAALQGKRLVVASESAQGARLDEATIKKITGGDPLTVRFLFKEHFTYNPQFKIWLVTNHQPVITGTDNGIWRRVRMIPFEAKFQGAAADSALPKKLKAELPGILAWALRGALAWQRDGLEMPEKVADATSEYRTEMDLLGRFLADMCVIDDEKRVKLDEFYAKYKAYTAENGIYTLAKHQLGRQMKERGFEQIKSVGFWHWRGVGLI